MVKRLGVCKCCNKVGLLNSKGICAECVYKKNHGGMSRQEVYKGKQKSKPLHSRKVTGEYELFLEIWNERPHVCENCGVPIFFRNRKEFVKKFSHVKSKGAYPELRLDKGNIQILCDTCHSLWEFGDREEFYNKGRHSSTGFVVGM